VELLILQLSPVYYFLALGPTLFLRILFSNSLVLCSPMNMRDQVAHFYKIRGKVTVLCTCFVYICVYH
jgi:hypothetical protein